MDKSLPMIRSMLKNRKVTQRELGVRVGLDQSQISRICNGAGTTVKTANAIAEALGCMVSDLTGEVAKQPISGYVAKTVSVLSDFELPRGLQELVDDPVLASALGITSSEWIWLLHSVPSTASKDGFITMLVTLRSVTKS
jgi:transcriptional regulator with XRE-family HTH domain